MVSATLRDLVNDRLALEELLDDPEIPEQAIYDTLEALDATLGDKMDGAAKILRHWSQSEDAINEEVKRLRNRAKMFHNRQTRLKGYLIYQLSRLNNPKVETALHTIAKRAGQQVVVVDDLDALPAEYVEVTHTARKAEIKTALRNGEEVPGAHLERGADFVVVR